jgi:hypothetical protein
MPKTLNALHSADIHVMSGTSAILNLSQPTYRRLRHGGTFYVSPGLKSEITVSYAFLASLLPRVANVFQTVPSSTTSGPLY